MIEFFKKKLSLLSIRQSHGSVRGTKGEKRKTKSEKLFQFYQESLTPTKSGQLKTEFSEAGGSLNSSI